jgi:hypothetical protein
MRFVVQFRSGESPTTNRYPHAVLVQDNWDDFGYKTTFHVTLHISADESYDLGSIKIIESGRTSGYTEMPRQAFTELPAGHASLGSSLDYYETLYKLGRDVFAPYFRGLRDVAFDDEIKAGVEDVNGGAKPGQWGAVKPGHRRGAPIPIPGPPSGDARSHCGAQRIAAG